MKISDQQAILIAGLGYGDEGKGSIVDFLTRRLETHTVVRYNGGAQAAHNVVDHNGRHHTFAQFGSGTFVPHVKTHLSKYMLVNPLNMLNEERHLNSLGITNALQRMSIDRRALITTPYHQATNRLKEIARNANRHGSCGLGIGETMADFLTHGEKVLFAEDLSDPSICIRKLKFLRELKLGEINELRAILPKTEQVATELNMLDDAAYTEIIADVYREFSTLVKIVDEEFLGGLLNQPGTVIFEGAQGVLLDEWYGFHPYTTWSTTTFKNADSLLMDMNYNGNITKLGLLRAYATRHGAGPFVTYDAELSTLIPDDHNTNNDWQHEFRAGYFDLVAAQYALQAVGHVDALVVSHLDKIAAFQELKICDSYTCKAGKEKDNFFEIQDSVVRRIKMQPAPNLEYQEQLTQQLLNCVPKYTSPPLLSGHSQTKSFLSYLEEQLQLPIAITSFGKTACNKWTSDLLLNSRTV